jgi:ribonuclease HI
MEPLSEIDHIIDEIRQLTPGQRRRLFRWLQASGLLIPEELMTDRFRLEVAPALGKRGQPGEEPAPALPDDSFILKEGGEYHSPVSGRVVVGGPQPEEPGRDDMLPLPGQAPEQPIQIIFDGGSKGNPGQGYGSYALTWPGAGQQVVRLQFGDRVTNNEAEYDTLIAALEAVRSRLKENRVDPAGARLEIWGDSQLVINQVNGEWACNEARLQVRRERARELLRPFGSWQLRYHRRGNSVRLLGH